MHFGIIRPTSSSKRSAPQPRQAPGDEEEKTSYVIRCQVTPDSVDVG